MNGGESPSLIKVCENAIAQTRLDKGLPPISPTPLTKYVKKSIENRMKEHGGARGITFTKAGYNTVAHARENNDLRNPVHAHTEREREKEREREREREPGGIWDKRNIRGHQSNTENKDKLRT